MKRAGHDCGAERRSRRLARRDATKTARWRGPCTSRWIAWTLCLGLVATAAWAPLRTAAGDDATGRAHERWSFFQELSLPAPSTSELPSDATSSESPPPESASQDAARFGPSDWYDFVVTPNVFAHARVDLGDLRLVDARGVEIPYALRIRSQMTRDESVSAKQFNDVVGEGGVVELSYDLGESPPEHNQVEVELAGENFRRLAVLFGGDDGVEWFKLSTRQIMRFRAYEPGQHDFDVRRLHYKASRYRYLKLHLERDPLVDREPPIVNAVHVHRRVEVDGEYETSLLAIGSREPTRAASAPASSWMLYFTQQQQPLERLRVKFAEQEFARDVTVETADSDGPNASFQFVQSGEWRRRADDTREFIEVEVPPREASRIRLTVVDHANPPLELTAAETVAPARQIVFARRPELTGPLRLYFGNPAAEPPQYDLQRNLPAELAPSPVRLALGAMQPNPDYVPPPLPVSERLPWLIYVVLGAASVVVAAILWDVSRRVIERHDAANAAKTSVAN